MKIIKIIIIVALVLFGLKWFFIRPANPEVTLKLNLIENEIEKMGYNPKWFVISGKRDWILTKLSYNNAKKGSQHLLGNAIDVEVIDIDGDGDYDNDDFKIFEKANCIVEKNNPKLRGALGTYLGPNSDWLERHQIHIDTRGKSKRYNQKI